MTSTVSFKSAITTRVNPETAQKLWSESRNLGNTLMCPAGAPSLSFDEFSRPVGGSPRKTLLFDDASCSPMVYSAGQYIRNENSQRPILGPCNPGDRLGADFMLGNMRSNITDNIYNTGTNKFVSVYGSHMKQPDEVPVMNHMYDPRTAKPLTTSHNALIQPNL